MRDLWARRGVRRAVRVVLVVGLVVLVFGVVLPAVVDYAQAWEAIKRLSWWQFVVLAVLGIARVVTEALVYRATLPRLRLRDGMLAYLNSTAAGTFLPPPSDAAIRYSMFKSFGVEQDAAAVTAIGTFIFPTAVRLIAPAVAFVLLVIVGRGDADSLVIALVCLAVAVAVGVVAVLVARSDRAARATGEFGGRVLTRVLVRLGRDPVENAGLKTVEFRRNAVTVAKAHWKAALLAVSLTMISGYLILLFALRFLHVGDGTLNWADVVGAYVLAQWINTVVPITADGLGVIDATLIALLAFGANEELKSTIVAAVLLWRVFFWALPLLLGAITLPRWRKANAGAQLVPDRAEVRDETERALETPTR